MAMFIGYRNLIRYIQKIRKNFRSIFVFVFTFKARSIKLFVMPFRSRNHALFYLTEHPSCSWNNLFAYKHSIQIQVREQIERGPRWLVYAALHSNGVMRHGNQRIVAKNGAYERIKVKSAAYFKAHCMVGRISAQLKPHVAAQSQYKRGAWLAAAMLQCSSLLQELFFYFRLCCIKFKCACGVWVCLCAPAMITWACGWVNFTYRKCKAKRLLNKR